MKIIETTIQDGRPAGIIFCGIFFVGYIQPIGQGKFAMMWDQFDGRANYIGVDNGIHEFENRNFDLVAVPSKAEIKDLAK